MENPPRPDASSPSQRGRSIALLHFTAPPVIGGVEQILAEHSRLLRAHGYAVTLLAGSDLHSATLGDTLSVHDIVIAHNLLTMPFAPEVTTRLWELAGQKGNTRFIAWVHDVAAANPAYAAAATDLLRRCSPDFEYIAVSERRRRELHDFMGLPLERCRVIPNGISPLDQWRLPERWHSFATSARLLERDLLLLHPARLVPRKNIGLSLHILAALRKAGHDAALLITAPADVHRPDAAVYEKEVRLERRELGLEEHAFFLSDDGPVTANELSAFYEMADAVIFPSQQEGFGLPVLEAALHRVPLFCARIEPLVSLLPGAATYFDLGDSPERIAAQIVRQVAASPAIQARRTVLRQYAWPAVYRNFIAPLLDPAPDSHLP